MILVQDAITAAEIETVRHWVSTHPKKQFLNWVENDRKIDNRWELDLEHPDLGFVTDLVQRYFLDWNNIWSAYQIQINPHNIHIDEYGKDVWPEKQCWTFILAFDTIPEFRTIIWQEQFRDGADLAQWIEHTWAPHRADMPRTNVSACQDLEHTYDHNNQDYFCDYLTLEGVFQYDRGQAVLFDGHKLHCTNNWRKYPQFDHRELLQIHVLSNSPRYPI